MIAPIYAWSNDFYQSGDTIYITVVGSSYTTEWYYITDNGDVEIEEAAGQLSYRPNPTVTYDVRIKVIGTGYAAGSGSDLVVSYYDPNDASNALLATNDDPEETASDLTFTAAERVDSYNVSWAAIENPDVVKYNVKISRDGGESWVTYKKLDADTTSLQVNGLYVGNSYSLRVYGASENGVPLTDVAPLEGTFAAVRFTTPIGKYSFYTPMEVTLLGAEDSSADIKWYSVTKDGETEIEEAAGLLSYTPTAYLGTVKVVATGTGISSGSSSEVIFEPQLNAFEMDYHALTRKADISWDAIEGATRYRIRRWKGLPDGTFGWADVPRAQHLTDTEFTLNGIYPGGSYEFRVYGYGEDGSVVGFYQDVIAPISAWSNDFYQSGDTIYVTIVGASPVVFTTKWYYITENGDVEIEEAAGYLSYTPSPTVTYDVRIKVIGAGYAAGSGSDLVVSYYDPEATDALLATNLEDAFADYFDEEV
ncbi:MAG: fibronectin type III domain-containing protein [Thermoguttaceae bacterium]